MADKRNVPLQVLVSSYEKGRFESDARAAGMTLSSWIRFLAMRVSEYAGVREVVVNGSLCRQEGRSGRLVRTQKTELADEIPVGGTDGTFRIE